MLFYIRKHKTPLGSKTTLGIRQWQLNAIKTHDALKIQIAGVFSYEASVGCVHTDRNN
jgi:hypothetical protein